MILTVKTLETTRRIIFNLINRAPLKDTKGSLPAKDANETNITINTIAISAYSAVNLTPLSAVYNNIQSQI